MKPAICSLVIALTLILCLPVVVLAAPPPSSLTTYTITVHEDGSALWQLEYRTPLSTDDDVRAFNNYTRDLPAVYLPQVRDLMERSVSQASAATARPMTVSNVEGTAVVQTSPTGNYGIVTYTFTWSGFAEPGSLAIGDAFAGGLYLGKDSTLILRYPAGWSVTSATPVPDQQQDGLVWYGLRSFNTGEPRVILGRSGFPVIPVIAGMLLILAILAGFVVLRRRRPETVTTAPVAEAEPEAAASAPLSPAEEAGLEERILHLLENGGGEQYQADMVRILGLPKSTVSSALNNLHQKGVIVKVRKGRENLIRLVRDRDSGL